MIPGALPIPTGMLPARIFELDPAFPIVAVCRSARVADSFNAARFTAGTRAGCMIAWTRDQAAQQEA
jgi:rhodanese-related sulfurtransferase